MTARRARLVSSLGAVLLAIACTNSYEIQIETPIRPKLDVGAFQRVLVAGFLAGGTEDVDGNLETTRLLRSQLRTKSELRVIDSDVLPLMDVASENRTSDGGAAPAPTAIKDQKDLEPYEHLFANVEYWKKIGEEYQQPLIVTGTVMSPLLRRRVLDSHVTAQIVILVDDVWTTGATLNECARILKEAGAKEVRALTVARADVVQRV